jgi:hypothetical protein
MSQEEDTSGRIRGILWPDPQIVKDSNIQVWMNRHQIQSYDQLLEKAVVDPEWFWDEMARELNWQKPYHQVLKWEAPHSQWFQDGNFNIVDNAVDRHARGPHMDKLAFIWQGEDGEVRKMSYHQLYQEVNRFANALQSLGVGKGEAIWELEVGTSSRSPWDMVLWVANPNRPGSLSRDVSFVFTLSEPGPVLVSSISSGTILSTVSSLSVPDTSSLWVDFRRNMAKREVFSSSAILKPESSVDDISSADKLDPFCSFPEAFSTVSPSTGNIFFPVPVSSPGRLSSSENLSDTLPTAPLNFFFRKSNNGI